MIIYYDGFCKLCYGFTSIVFRFSKPGTFMFQPLQGSDHETKNGSYDTVIVETSTGVLLYKSDAVRFILKHLPWPFRIINLLISLFSEKFQNYIYDFIARNRYQWFGKNDSCKIPG